MEHRQGVDQAPRARFPGGGAKATGLAAAVERSDGPPVTALLVDDNALFRRGVRMLLLAHGIGVIGEASNGRDAVRLTSELRPDVVVMDTEMPIMDGIEATSAICSAPDAPAVLVLAAAASGDALDAIIAGARALLLKSCDGLEIATAVRLAAAGQSTLSPAVAGMMVKRMRELENANRPVRARPDTGLTTREHDVLRLLADGRDNPSIGAELFISSSTVKHHVASILGKLEVNNRVQAAVEAVRIGLA